MNVPFHGGEITLVEYYAIYDGLYSIMLPVYGLGRAG